MKFVDISYIIIIIIIIIGNFIKLCSRKCDNN